MKYRVLLLYGYVTDSEVLYSDCTSLNMFRLKICSNKYKIRLKFYYIGYQGMQMIYYCNKILISYSAAEFFVSNRKRKDFLRFS